MIPEIIPIMLMPLIVLFSLAFSLGGLALVIYAVYDVLVNQDKMEDYEKAIWILVVVLTHFIGAIIYLLVVKGGGEPVLNNKSYSELEKLYELREKDVITDEEYERLKKKFLEDKN